MDVDCQACSLTPGFVLTSLTEKVDIHSPFVKAISLCRLV